MAAECVSLISTSADFLDLYAVQKGDAVLAMIIIDQYKDEPLWTCFRLMLEAQIAKSVVCNGVALSFAIEGLGAVYLLTS